MEVLLRGATQGSNPTEREVKQRLTGLDEKFRVLNNEDLADALSDRTENVFKHSQKWIPDVVHLLLELADDPVNKTRLEDVDVVKPAAKEAPPTWEGLLRDDPLDDNGDDLWDVPDFGAESSGEGEDDEEVPETQPRRSPSPVADGTPYLPPLSTVSPDLKIAQDILRLRKDMDASPIGEPLQISESQVIRATLFMFRGLSTNIYDLLQDGTIYVKRRVVIKDVHEETLRNCLESFAHIGTGIVKIWKWIRVDQIVHLVQRFQSCLETCLQNIWNIFLEIETKMARKVQEPTTLNGLHLTATNATKHILELGDLAKDYGGTSGNHAFTILETLYLKVNDAQAMVDHEGYKYYAHIFFDCLSIYLEPLTAWMERAELNEEDTMFFIKKTEDDKPMEEIWSSQFQLVRDREGFLHAPKFLHLAANKILNTGKSVKLLAAINQDLPSPPKEHPLTFETVCRPIANNQKISLPFAGTFASAFDDWVTQKHMSTSSNLCKLLLSDRGLLQAFDALDHIYLSLNGSLTTQIAEEIFERIDNPRRIFNDSYILQDVFEEVFHKVRSIDPRHFSVRIIETEQITSVSRRSLLQLDAIRVTYALPWDVSTIITPGSRITYQEIQIMILKTQRAKWVLDRCNLKSLHRHDVVRGVQNALIFQLRHRLRWFAEVCQNYIVTTVVASSRVPLREELEKARDMDELIAVYQKYLGKLSYCCLLDKKADSTLQALKAILELAVVFADTVNGAAPKEVKKASIGVHKPYDDSDDDYEVEAGDGNEDGNGVEKKNKAEKDGPVDEQDKDKEAHSDLMHNLETYQATYIRLLDFVLAGVREASRTKGESIMEVLIENLAYGAGEDQKFERWGRSDDV